VGISRLANDRMISDATLRRVFRPSTVALTGDLVRALLWAAVAVIWLAFLQVYVKMWRLTIADPAHSDFTIFYYTARLVADGFPMYGASPARYGIDWSASHLGNLNPPHFQLFIQPLARFSYEQAFIVWTAVSFLALVASVLIIARAHDIELTGRRLAIWGAFVVSCAGFTTVAITSELTFLLMVPFSLALLEARRGRWFTAGLWLGVCASIKLFLLVFVVWLLIHRRWRALAGAAAGAGTAVAIGVLAYSPATYLQWIGSLGQVGWEWFHLNASWPGFLARIGRRNPSFTHIGDASEWIRPASLLGSAVLCIVTLVAARRRADDATDVDVHFLLLVTAALLASPLGWAYYLPLALGPVVGVLWTGAWRRLPRPVLIALAAGAAYLYVPPDQAKSGQPSPFATVLLASSYFWGTLALWMGAAAAAVRGAECR
jgi:hypothetical protein